MLQRPAWGWALRASECPSLNRRVGAGHRTGGSDRILSITTGEWGSGTAWAFSPLVPAPTRVGRGGPWGKVVEGHRADELWAELGKDSLPRGRTTTHLGAVWESGNFLPQQNPKDWEGEHGHPRGSCPPLHGPGSGRRQGWAARQEAWVLDSTLPSICCMTLGEPLPFSEHQSAQ